MSGLEGKVEIIRRNLERKGIQAGVSFEKSTLMRKPLFRVLVYGIDESKDIQLSGDVQSVLRDIAGYGTVNSNYDPKKKEFILSYSPIEKDKTLTVGSLYTTPGCKDF